MLRVFYYCSVVCLLFVNSCMVARSVSKVDLQGRWSIEQVGGDVKVSGDMPGGVHSALYEAGVIVDPYYGCNEEKIQWVAEEDWLISRKFNLDDSFLDYEDIYLEVKNPDTFCEFRVNGNVIGASDNIFYAYKANVKEYLHAGENEIEILLKSPLKESAAIKEKYANPFPSQQGNFNLIRKVQCHNGWDWGIKMPVSGITDEIYLLAANDPVIEQVYSTQKHSEGKCEVTVNINIAAEREGQAKVKVQLAGQQKTIDCCYKAGDNKVSASIIVDNPKLWWPAGYGEQNLYELKVSIGDQVFSHKIGLREVELVNEDDEVGTSMMFRINGVDVFCKGANWIPCDAFMNRQTPEKYRYLLESAVDANMNMIRAWGGGYYEKDVFYELCDELGIMVWQDMMFSCATYPADEDFLASVKKETIYQAGRLNDHPSVVIWCGDNECVGAIGWYEESRNNRPYYEQEWQKLSDVRSGALMSVLPDVVYWPSSPSDGKGLGSDGWSDDTKGDMHYWEVWHGGKPFEAYYEKQPRFCSEFGYQSLPSMESVASFAPADQLDVESEVFKTHQKSKGNNYIIEMFERYFHAPKDFESTVYLSQLQQAKAIKTAAEFWRSLKPVCQGILFWQLNDNWPVCSWSSIEYNGNWKQLQYHAKRFFAPVMSCAIGKEDKYELYCVSDLLTDADAEIEVCIYDFAGELLAKKVSKLKLQGQSSTALEPVYLSKLPGEPGECFAVLKTTAKADGKTYSHENTVFFTVEKECQLQLADVQADIVKSGDSYTVKLTTDKPAFFVMLETPGIKGRFSDNSFTLLPGEPKTVQFTADEYRLDVDLEDVLKVISLRDSYE